MPGTSGRTLAPHAGAAAPALPVACAFFLGRASATPGTSNRARAASGTKEERSQRTLASGDPSRMGWVFIRQLAARVKRYRLTGRYARPSASVPGPTGASVALGAVHAVGIV